MKTIRTILIDSATKKPGQTYIKTITPPDKGTQLYGDAHPDADKGLYLKVSKTGTMVWLLLYYAKQPNGKTKQVWYTLGKYPGWKPVRARK
jgi:hypothetical protein